MSTFKEHFLTRDKPVEVALSMIDELGSDGVLFVIDNDGKLIGSLSDGDIRRGLIRGLTLNTPVEEFCEKSPKYIVKANYLVTDIIKYRLNNLKIVPVLDHEHRIVDLINYRHQKSYLPVDAVIMAGGRGQRLSPLTDSVPKPLLKVGSKPIIEHNVDRLKNFGIKDFWITIRYLGHQIEEFFGNGEDKKITINYVREDTPLGTIGALRQINDFKNEYVLITNSDLLTTIDYEAFFCNMVEAKADICVASVSYSVSVPYAIFETHETQILALKEKPTYTYFVNAGIYFCKKSVLDLIPPNSFYNATDLLEACIEKKLKVHTYQITDYWLDIGKMDDFAKAQEDIKHIKNDRP